MELRYRKENRFPANSALLIRRREAHSSPLHAHDFFELEIVVEGTGKQILNGKEYTFGKGNYWLLNPADFHQVLPNTDAVVWNIGFDETLIPESLLETVYGGQYKSLQLLEEENVAICPASAFGPAYNKIVRLSYATSLEDIRFAMEHMEKFVRKILDEKK